MAMTRKISEMLMALSLLCCNSGFSQERIQKNHLKYPWQFTAPMPIGKYGHDAVHASNGKIYVMGGLTLVVSRGFKKDNKLNSWIISQVHKGYYSNLAYNKKLKEWEYMSLVPGWGQIEFITIFDPNKEFWRDQWRQIRGFLKNYSADERRRLTQSSIPNGKPLRTYDTDLNRFGNGLGLCKSNESIYWTGGKNFGGNVENIALPYNIENDTWPTVATKQNGNQSNAAPKPYWEYDQRESYETKMPPMQERRCDHQAVEIAGKIYVLGGWREETAVNKWGDTYNTGKDIVSKTMECYDPKTNRWEYRRPLERERMTFAAVAGKDDKIYVLGGAAGMADDPNTPILDTVEVYDPKSDSWSRRRPMPTPRYDHVAVLAADGRIYIIGGAESFENISSGVYVYDPDSDSWEQGPDMIIPRAALAAAATPDGKIYAIGGTDVGAYKNKKNWSHLTSLISRSDLGDYEGKVQETVEVLDINKWRNSKKAK